MASELTSGKELTNDGGNRMRRVYGAHDFITGRQQFIDFVHFINWIE